MRKIIATTAAMNRPPAALFLPRSTIPHRGESKALPFAPSKHHPIPVLGFLVVVPLQYREK
jgi:hypothetical protein